MFGPHKELFRLFGFSVRVDLSWLIIALLVTWSLAEGFFPRYHAGYAAATYWVMGVAGMVGLFMSIVLHELAHSLIARRFGMPIRGITLFIFGGVAHMDDEPPSPKAEFFVAIAGPIASVLIAAASFGMAYTGQLFNWPLAVTGVFLWLGWINTVLVVFNLIPAFPLDGGRVLRAALWHWKQSIRKATRVTSMIGSAFGIFLIFLGLVVLFGGNLIGGLWYALIGLFLRGAARMSYQQLLVRRALEGEPLRRFMSSDPVTVSPKTTLTELVDEFIYRHHFKMFPVVEDSRLLGCVTTRDVQSVPRGEWDRRKVSEITRDCSDDTSIPADADAMQALSLLSRTGASRAVVVENGSLVGVVSLKDLMRFLSMKIELETDDPAMIPFNSDGDATLSDVAPRQTA